MKFHHDNTEATLDTLVSWDCDVYAENKFGGVTAAVKSNLDGLENIIIDSPGGDGNLAELKPLPPFDYMTNNNVDPMLCNNNNITMDEASLYKTSLNPFPSTSDVVSSSNVMLSSAVIKNEQELVLNDVVNDEFAAIIGNAMCADSTVNTDPVSGLDSTDIGGDWTDIQLDDWIDKVCSSGPKNNGHIVDSLSSSLNSGLLDSHSYASSYGGSPNSSISSSTNNLITSSVNISPPSSMQSLLNNANGGSPPIKREPFSCMPILQARLQNSQMDLMPKPETTYMKPETTYMKPESTFNNSCSLNKDSMPHTTNPCPTLGGYGFHRRPFPKPSSSVKELDTTDLLGAKSKSKYRFGKSNKMMPILTDGTKEKPIHRCGICNRGFLNKSNIKVHLRTHTGEKPFKCDTCGKSFRQKAHLIKHNHIHKRSTRD